jgi:hypothetical protein
MIDLAFQLLHAAILAGPNVVKFGARVFGRKAAKAPPALPPGVTAKALSLGPTAPTSAAWTRYNGARPEPRGAPVNTLLALGGFERWSPEDLDAFFDLCDGLGIPCDSLATVIRHESHADPAALNPEPAAGLIQVTTYAKLPGFETKEKVRAIVSMTTREQLAGPVKQYYARGASVVRGMTPGEMMLFNFTPAFVGKAESTVISSRGEPIYDHNYKAFDVDGKGTITVGDVYKAAERITAEARGRRLMRDGTIVEPPPNMRGTAPAVSVAPAPKPAVKPASAPRRPAPPPPTPEQSDEQAPQPEIVGMGSSASTAPPGTTSTPSASGPSAITGAIAAVKPALADDAASESGALLDAATGALSSLTTGGSALSPEHDVRGLLLAAVRAQTHDPIGWTWVAVPGEDLEVLVPNDAFKATLGDTPHVRIPVTYAELREVCRLLSCVPAAKFIVDAIYQAAAVHTTPIGLVQNAGDDKRMNTAAFVLRHHANVEQQLAQQAQSAQDGALVEPVGKWWLVDPKLATSKFGEHAAVTYGWFRTSVADPVQTPQAPHDDNHSDYSQVARAVHRFARRASNREQRIDLIDDVYAQKWPELAPFLDALRAEGGEFSGASLVGA